MGSNQWRYFDSWPVFNHKSYYFSSTGLASLRDDEGVLTENLPETCPDDIFVHDPWRPVPSLGGHAAIPAGSFDRSAIDCRADVLTYTSEPLAEDLHLAGDVVGEIWCKADAPSFDLCAVLSEVKYDGSVCNLTQGYLRVNPGEDSEQLLISLQSTCVMVARGNALRLSLSAACFPAYAVNAGTGLSAGESRLMEARIITLTVSCGGDCPSQILLPVV